MADGDSKTRCCGRTKIALWVCALVLVIGGGAWGWANYLQTYHLATVQDGVLVRDGNRGIREFETALRKTGTRTVVSLIDDREFADPKKPQFAQEMELCRERGVKFVRLPVKLGGWPTTEDVRKFLDIVEKKENQPVLVHCAQGVRRTGMMVAAFQESLLGWDDAKAKAAMLTFGHSGRTIKDVERFIGVYDPKDRKITAQLAQSQEN
jgi:protein tyrosine/serine phosphatase